MKIEIHDVRELFFHQRAGLLQWNIFHALFKMEVLSIILFDDCANNHHHNYQLLIH
jgi:hypothetical protein